MKALSVRQPWAWLLLYGQKDVENRDWGTLYRGEIAIHAAKGMTLDEYKDAVAFVHTFNPDLAARIPAPHALVRGSILGTCQMVDCVTEHPSRWFQGLYGFVMREPRAWHKPVPARGALGLWEWTPAEMPSIKDTVGPLVCASGGSSMAEQISSRAAKALFTVWNASQTGDPNDLEAPLKGLESLRDRGLLIEWPGHQGGRFFIVSQAGKQILRSTPPASLRD